MLDHLIYLKAGIANNNLPHGLSVGKKLGQNKRGLSEYPITKSGFFEIDGSKYSSMTLPNATLFVLHDYPYNVSINGNSFNNNNFIGYYVPPNESSLEVTINTNKTFGASIILIGKDTPKCDVMSLLMGEIAVESRYKSLDPSDSYCIVGLASDSGILTFALQSSYNLKTIDVFTLDSSNQKRNLSLAPEKKVFLFDNVRTSIIVTTYHASGTSKITYVQTRHSSSINSILRSKDWSIYFENESSDGWDSFWIIFWSVVGFLSFILCICILLCDFRCYCSCKKVSSEQDDPSPAIVFNNTTVELPPDNCLNQGYTPQTDSEASSYKPVEQELQMVYPVYPAQKQNPYVQPPQYQQGLQPQEIHTSNHYEVPYASPYDDMPIDQ